MRPEVKAFAEEMEKRLAAHDHDSENEEGWAWCRPGWLLNELKSHTGSLQEHVSRLCDSDMELAPALATDRARHRDLRHRVVQEAADVANYALMLADVCGPQSSRKRG